MSNHMRFKYRVVIHIAEDDEWEEQEVISGSEWDSQVEAEAEAESVDLSRYPLGSRTYLEWRSYSPWAEM